MSIRTHTVKGKPHLCCTNCQVTIIIAPWESWEAYDEACRKFAEDHKNCVPSDLGELSSSGVWVKDKRSYSK